MKDNRPQPPDTTPPIPPADADADAVDEIPSLAAILAYEEAEEAALSPEKPAGGARPAAGGPAASTAPRSRPDA